MSRQTLVLCAERWNCFPASGVPTFFTNSVKGVLSLRGTEKALPRITNTMLTSTLRDLEELGSVHREQFNEISPHVEYSLTDKGKALLPVFCELAKWGENNLD